jgi:hypothetical protein
LIAEVKNPALAGFFFLQLDKKPGTCLVFIA